MVIEAPVNHVANAVQNNQQQLATQLHKMQAMIQTMQMQYAAGPQKAHQDYGGHRYHGGHANYRGQGGRGGKGSGDWQSGRGGCVNMDLTHYWIHGMCVHPSKDCRTPAEGQIRTLCCATRCR